MIKSLVLVCITFMLSCSSHKVSVYSDDKPELNLKDFFDGHIYALGIVEDRNRKVINRFKVYIKASWNGKVATLDEDFVYADGSTSKRIWKLKNIGKGSFEGQAGDVKGLAIGKVSGNTFHFEYTLNLPVGDTTYEVHFDDWMYLLDNNTLMARTYMSKWGFDVGEVTIVMMKKDLK